MDMGKTLYGYVRQSKDDDGKGHSLDYQIRVGNQVKDRFGFDDFILFNEGSGVSGTTNPLERESFRKLIELIDNGNVSNLYVFEWSRLSRDNFYSEYLRKKIKDNNILLYEGDCTEPKELNNPIDQLTSSILSSIYTYERQNMVKRIKEGLIQSRKNLKWSGIYLPYGYSRNEGGTVSICEIESPIYLKIVEFTRDGRTVRWITNWLNDNSVPTKNSRVNKKGFIKRKSTSGKEIKQSTLVMMWRDNVVRGILNNTYYKGLRTDKEGNQYEFPNIISVDEWDSLQIILKENVSKNRRGNKSVHKYLLKNLIFCKRDDSKFLGRIKTDERTYYCGRKRKEVRLKGELPCSIPSPNLDRFEQFIWENLTRILKDSKLIREEFKIQQLKEKELKNSKSNLESEIDKIDKKIIDITNQKERILKLYMNNVIEEKTYYKEYKVFDKEKSELSDLKINHLNNLILLGDSKFWVDWVNKFSEEVNSWEKNPSFEYKREKVEKYISKIVIDFNEKNSVHVVDIVLKYPMINDELIWNDKNDKSKGYTIKSGNIVVSTVFSKPHINISQHLLYNNDMRL